MNAIALACALLQAAATLPAVTDTVRYEIAFPNSSQHEAEITVTWQGLPGQPLELRMSRSSPGRYALHEFGKNVYSVRAVDGGGRELSVTRPNPHQWDVPVHDGTVRLTYTLFADRADGTYSAVDVTQAHLNIPATFMWARGTGERPVSVRFHAPAGARWSVATQLRPTADPFYYTAPHLQYFMDSPTNLSALQWREWQVSTGGPAQTIRIAMHHLGTAAELDEYTRHTQAIVREQAAVFGGLPRFDYGTYTFIAAYVPWASGDGMEHRNSTILTNSGSLASNMPGLLGTVSHEFFHAWNVERLRPRSLEPFDFERENMSGELWFAEGFTSYYGPLTMRRGAVTDDARYVASLTGMLNTVINAPGRRYFSPYEMSLQAPFVDAATSVDPQNRANTFISYYTWGAAIGLGLDLTLRTRFPGVTLDDYMRALWQKYGVHEANFTPTRPYTMTDLRVTLGEVVRDSAFANDFFRRFIEGRDVVDYATLLGHAGITLRAVRPGAPSIGGARFTPSPEGGVLVQAPVLVGTTLYDAGVSGGDRLLAIGGVPVSSAEQVAAIVAAQRPGTAVELVVEQRGVRRTARATIGEDATLDVVLNEAVGLPVTPAQRQFRQQWLGARGN
jgi:predicted metalloprotease with PDZ domain